VTVGLAANPNLGRLYMPRRPLAHAGAELSGRSTAIQIARAQLFNVDVDRKKRIDDTIDYFGAGHIAVGERAPSVRAPNSTGRDEQVLSLSSAVSSLIVHLLRGREART
jgi:hypothetical protein